LQYAEGLSRPVASTAHVRAVRETRRVKATESPVSAREDCAGSQATAWALPSLAQAPASPGVLEELDILIRTALPQNTRRALDCTPVATPQRGGEIDDGEARQAGSVAPPKLRAGLARKQGALGADKDCDQAARMSQMPPRGDSATAFRRDPTGLCDRAARAGV